ncbi:protein of unknown function DUF1311 [Halomonas sp. KO116]|nr:protein of unknown function DUF1311 [Halomonas sp. KO116]
MTHVGVFALYIGFKTWQPTIALVSCLILPVAATAQSSTEDEYAARFGKCMDASGGVTVEILNCIADEIATQDALLNGAYSDARRDLSEERQQVLLNAQRHWINYRDVNCDFYANIGGTLAQIASNECFLRETAERAAELENMVGW